MIILTTGAPGRLSMILSSDDHWSIFCLLFVSEKFDAGRELHVYLRGFYRNNSTVAG